MMPNADPLSTAERVLEHAIRWPDKRAVVCDEDVLTYSQLSAMAQVCAGRLQSLGFAAGGARRVGLLSSNSLDFAVVAMACQLAGVPLVPLPGLVAPDAQARMLDDSGVALLFYDEDHKDAAHAAVRLSSEENEILVVAMGIGSSGGAFVQSMLGQWLASSNVAFTPVPIDPSWQADLIYSSGTTGLPKGIIQSYEARRGYCITLAKMGVTEDSQFLQPIGLYSNFGMASLLLALWWGGTFFTLRKFSAQQVVGLLQREKVNMAWFAPAALIRTTENEAFAAAVLGKPSVKLCAGAPLSPAHKVRILTMWPGPFYDLYGQAETGTLSLLAIHSSPAEKQGSVGHLLPTVKVQIVDDAGHPLPVDGEGEIVAHTTTMMSGYHEQKEATASAYWKNENGLLYVRTGDIGKLDPEGYLWLCDRKKDMILSGGFNIYPADIERLFQDHPAVSEVAVVGIQSARWGETPVAFLTLRAEQQATEEELCQWVNSKLGAIQRVALVKIIPVLPEGTMGKILKRALRDKYAESIGTLP